MCGRHRAELRHEPGQIEVTTLVDDEAVRIMPCDFGSLYTHRSARWGHGAVRPLQRTLMRAGEAPLHRDGIALDENVQRLHPAVGKRLQEPGEISLYRLLPR